MIEKEKLLVFINANCRNVNGKLDGSKIHKILKNHQIIKESLFFYTNYLNGHNIVNMLRVQCFISGIDEIPKCTNEKCSNDAKILKRRISKTCSNKCACEMNNHGEKIKRSWDKYSKEEIENIVNKRKTTCLNKYGVDNPSKSEHIKEKYKQTCMERYGVDNTSKSKDIIDKIKKASLRNGIHFNSTEEVQTKKKVTCMERYGVDNYSKTEAFKAIAKGKLPEDKYKARLEKTKNTCLERYGVDNVMWDPEIADRAGGKYTWFTYEKDNKSFRLQGFEDKFLDEYYENNGNLNGILSDKKDMPEIYYVDVDGTKRRYYPDFYIPSQNKIIEVKSEYTWFKYFIKNILKAESTIDNGFEYVLKIYE